LGTLLIIEAQITTATQLVISFVKTKVDGDGRITDSETLNRILQLIQSLKDTITGNSIKTISAPILMNEVK
jgi:chromate reductase, NAD(P)H dehydrogenase (quinone)